ncbi:hypothetical protein AAG747_03580 [Rapidithrix thailandica]|uniref:Uncharacterized protein n=1 Tax=Rapidithrix thailandica TaxID=413964 RepID=A0AAW9S7R7_9BACT
MYPSVKKFFSELEKYEKEGTDSMDWAEWASLTIDQEIVRKFTVRDWSFIKGQYKEIQVANIRSDKDQPVVFG